MSATIAETEILFITSRRLDADDHGAGVRTARIADVLQERYRVTVAEPAGEGDPAPDVIEYPPWTLDLRHVTEAAATEGASMWAAMAPALPELVATRAPVVFWADAILASAGLGRVLPEAIHVVEFANIESRRYLAMALDGSWKRRAFAVTEAVKALAWQPRVARGASAVVALAPSDAKTLRARGPRLLVRNGMTPTASATPSSGRAVLAVGSWWYGPNRHGMRRFLTRDWPRVRAALPDATLRIVGSGGADVAGRAPDGVEVLGYVDDLGALYRDAALVLAPARSGGGSQLKIGGALAQGRIVVGPAFLARELSPSMPPGALQADDDMAETLVRLLPAPEARHAIESLIRAYARGATWQHEAEPLTRFLDRALRPQPR